MDKYLMDWLKVIDGIKQDNTYKAAWGKAVIECILKGDMQRTRTHYIIEEYFIVQKVLKYYWNMNVFFGIHQDDYLVVERIIAEMAVKYNKRRKITRVWYNKAENFMKRTPVAFEKIIRKLITTVNKNVAYRFMNVGRKKYDLYELDVKKLHIKLTHQQVKTIKKNKVLLNDLINYRWIMFLENFNDNPHLALSVFLLDKDNIHAKKLEQYTSFIDF